MTAKTLGSDLNSVIGAVLIKKTKFDILIKNLNKYTIEKTEALTELIKEIQETLINLNRTLYSLEIALEKTSYEIELFTDDTVYYKEVLPVLKEKFIDIFNTYLEIFALYEQQIEYEIGEKINVLLEKLVDNRRYSENIYNYELVSNHDILNSDKNSKYLLSHPYHSTWYFGKFYDEYLNKSIDGSLEIFHKRTRKNSKRIDFCSNEGNSIYENIFYHPDYGMLHYISTGKNSNASNYTDLDTQVPNINFDVLIDDEFKGEFTEIKNKVNTFYGNNKAESTKINKDNTESDFHMSFTHLSPSNESEAVLNSQNQLDRKTFIHKIAVHEAKDSLLPSLFFIGQNKDIDKTITTNFINSSNKNVAVLTPNRQQSILNDNNIGFNELETELIESDSNITRDFNMFLIALIEAYKPFSASIMILNYKNKVINKLASIFLDNRVTNYIYDDFLNEFGSKKNIIGCSINTSKDITEYDLFENKIFRINQDYNNNHISNYNLVESNILIESNGLINSNQRFHLIKENKNDLFIAFTLLQNLNTELFTGLRNDTRLNNYSAFERYFNQAAKILNKQNLPAKNNNKFILNYIDTYSLDNNALKYNRIWWHSFNVSYLKLFKASFFGLCLIPYTKSDFYSIINSSKNELNIPKILDRDIDNIIFDIYKHINSDIYIHSSDNFISKIGELKYIPYDISNPIYLFDNKFAKSGSILQQKDYPDAFKIFGLKYIEDHPNKSCNPFKEFMLPNLADQYLIGAKDSDILEEDLDAIPNLKYKIDFDSDPDKNYTGLLSNKPGDKVIGTDEGLYGYGAVLSPIEIRHKSTSSKTKGNDARFDIYIRVKD